MKRDLPILWKYLLVVAATCALALLIAQNEAAAQTPAGPYSSTGAFAVQVSEAA